MIFGVFLLRYISVTWEVSTCWICHSSHYSSTTCWKNSLGVVNWVHATQILLNMEGKKLYVAEILCSLWHFFPHLNNLTTMGCPIWNAIWVNKIIRPINQVLKNVLKKYFLCLYLHVYVFALLDQYLGIFIFYKVIAVAKQE